MAALRLVSLAVGVAVVLSAARAGAWGSSEHQEIGRASYLAACADVGALVRARGTPSPGVTLRLENACGRNLDALAALYGDATTIAGDFLDEPSEFFSEAGAWRFHSRKSYWLLALENSAHFNPMATQSWAEYHAKAVEEALAAASADGLAAVVRLQLAVQESAFADHFLQDSFAAGHMGFNRTASSAAASKSFHDTWNKRGRIVSDRSGNRWVTYGDGWLNRGENLEGRRHVMDAATLSVRNLLRAYVLGERAPDEELAIWRALPFTIQAPELHVDVVEVFERRDDPADRALVPLIATIRPARKNTVLTARLWSATPFSQPDDEVLAAVAGFELAVPRIPAQTYLGAGGTVREPGGIHSGVVDTGVLFPIALSLSGLMSHQLDATVSWLIRNPLDVIVHGEYQMKIELGDVLLSLQLGVAELFPRPRPGCYAAIGLGLNLSSAGGGAF